MSISDFWDSIIEAGGDVASEVFDATLHLLDYAFVILPDGGTLPPQTHAAAAEFGENLALVNLFLPVDTMLVIIGIFISVQFVLLSFRLTIKVIGLLRGVDLLQRDNTSLIHH